MGNWRRARPNGITLTGCTTTSAQNTARFTKCLKKSLRSLEEKKKLDSKCNLVEHYTRRMKIRTCRELVTANYACSCDKVIREKEMCVSFEGCYESAKTTYIATKKETRKKMPRLSWSGVQLAESSVLCKSWVAKQRGLMLPNSSDV